MYSKFYGFTHKPFELSPDPDLVFLSETHQEALAVLLYGVYNRKGFLQISGNVGTGKSTLVQALIQKLESNVHLCHIPNPNFTVAEFYYYIGAKFGLEEFTGNKAKFILNLAQFLKQCRENGEFALLIIDEAQVLSLEVLEEIRLLSNQEYTEFGVLSIFFVGQPELNGLLKHKKMEPLRNRIGVRFNLEPLTLDETVAYIQFRLRKAGRTAPLFSSQAIQKIHEASGGIPRSINILCDNGLLAGFAEQRGIIDENIIINCIKEIEQPDAETIHSESEEIQGIKKKESISPVPPRKRVNKEAKKYRGKSPQASLPKKLAYAFAIICALFITMIYTTDYWGRLPGTDSVKSWFEKLHENAPTIKKIEELFITLKSDKQFNATDKNILIEKVITLSDKPENKNYARNESAAEKNSAVKPAEENLSAKNLPAEIIETKQLPEQNNVNNSNKTLPEKPETNAVQPGEIAEKIETQHIPEQISQSSANQPGPESALTSPESITPPVEQIAIRRNPDGTTYIDITRQKKIGQEGEISPENEAIAAPDETLQKADKAGYVSISDQVGGANIRSGPSMDDEIIRAVIPGYPFRVIGQYNDWSMVEDFKKRKGWVASKLIKENNTAILKSDTANILSGPSYNNDVIGNLDYGTVLQVQDKNGSWVKVYKEDGMGGWIREDAVWP